MDAFTIEESFPTVIRPKAKVSLEEFSQQLIHFKMDIANLLLKKGALLFRGFPLVNADDFTHAIETLNFGKFINYIGGDSPRDKVKNKVYTSTEAPASFHLPLHQELSYIKHYPKHIYFFCEIEPKVRGETIIADARKVYNSIDPSIIKKFQDKSLRYISRYYYKSKRMAMLNRFNRSHKSWIEVFETDSKIEVEKICDASEFDWRWLPKDWIEIKQTRPALLEHPITKETVWFNQAHLYDFNPKLLGFWKYIGSQLFYMKRSTRLHEITYADGHSIQRKDLYHILEVLDNNTVAYPWKKGDLMLLDNILAMHGRAPYQGKRRILTSLTI